jgi:hypothetical protein
VKIGFINSANFHKNEKSHQKGCQKGGKESGKKGSQSSQKDCEEGRQEGAQIASGSHITIKQKGRPTGRPFLWAISED